MVIDVVEELLTSPAGYVLVGVWGALWGSFLNVCIHRLPKGKSVVRPSSCCPACGSPIRAWDNIPVLSWLFLRGRCRDCNNPISMRYPLVEAITAVLSVAIFHNTLQGAPPGEPLVAILAMYLALFMFVAALIVVAFIDLDHLIIPNSISYPGIVVGFLYSCLPGGITPLDSFIGMSAGALSLLLIIHLYARIRGLQGMGYGDVKLLAMIGAFIGPHPLLFVVFAAALQGILAAGLLALARRMGWKDLPLYDPALFDEDDEVDPATFRVDSSSRRSASSCVPLPEAAAAGEVAEGAGGVDGEENGVAQAQPEGESAPQQGQNLEQDQEAGEESPRSVFRLAIPFGPFLALGAIEYLLIGELLIGGYLAVVERIVSHLLGL